MPIIPINVGFQGQSGRNTDIAELSLLMLWTAPTLRHRSAIGWLR
jgi:hypothetical protein